MEEMLAGMTMSEYVHWQAIYETEPFPEERADRRAASQMINMRRALGDKGALELVDFIPDWWGENHAQTPEQIKANIGLVKAASKKKKPKK